jgi:Ca2+-binding EF-hand superfamily protein
MGTLFAKKLSHETKALAIDIFNEIDRDGNHTIELNETVAWWKTNFGRVNAKAMFESVDSDRNGTISLDEWLNFWERVLNSSHSEIEIVEELTNIRNGGSWVLFQSMPGSSLRD